MRAVWRLRANNTITQKQYRRFKVAAYSGIPIAASDEKDAPKMVFIQHLRDEVKHRMKGDATIFAQDAPTGIFDDLFENFSFDGVVEWIMENWQIIFQVLMALMVFLQTAEDE